MSVDQLTVQQLKIFLAVYKHKSASLAAAELGVTNSTVSRALAAARSVFDDVLFVRTANGFVPTNKAHELASPTSDIVSILRKIDTRYTRFLPATCTGSIEIRAYDEFNYAVQRVIQTRIQPLAPRMHFHVSALTYDCVNELLNGTVDYAVVYEGFNDNRLNFECFSQTGDIFLLCRKGHPLLSGDFGASDLSCYPLVEIDNYRDNSSPLLVDICHEVGSNMRTRLYGIRCLGFSVDCLIRFRCGHLQPIHASFRQHRYGLGLHQTSDSDLDSHPQTAQRSQTHRQLYRLRPHQPVAGVSVGSSATRRRTG